MTTTERRTSPLELRLYAIAVLAAVYTITWRAIGGHAPAASEPESRFVWIDTLPPPQQPAVALPTGWQRAEVATPRSTGLVHVPAPRAPRMRTRSS